MLSSPRCTSSAQTPPTPSLSFEDWLELSNWVNGSVTNVCVCVCVFAVTEMIGASSVCGCVSSRRLGSVFHKDVGRGQSRAPGGGLDSALPARR